MGAVSYHVYCRILGSVTALLLHGGNSVAQFLALRGDILKDPDIAKMHANQFRYLTIWNVAFQMVYSALNLACDLPLVLKLEEEPSSILNYLKYLRKYRKIFYGGVIFPTGMAIFLVFWPYYLYDREMIFPSFIDKVFSHTSNQIMHTAIFPIILWELLFLPRSKPSSHMLYLGHMAVIFFGYLIVLLDNYAKRGTWPYPIFYYIYGTIYFPTVVIALGILYIMIYFAQWPLTSLLYTTDSHTKSKKIR